MIPNDISDFTHLEFIRLLRMVESNIESLHTMEKTINTPTYLEHFYAATSQDLLNLCITFYHNHFETN